MPPELDDDHVVAICEVLIEHQVDFVIIGGIAARMHDTDTPGSTSISAPRPPSRSSPDRRLPVVFSTPNCVSKGEIEGSPLNRTRITVGSVDMPVPALSDVVASKRVTRKLKDIIALPDRWPRDRGCCRCGETPEGGSVRSTTSVPTWQTTSTAAKPAA